MRSPHTTLPLPVPDRPQTLMVETSYAGPNGEIQTLRGRVQRWPAAVQVGMRAESGVSVGKPLVVQLLALGTDGKPRAGVPLTLTTDGNHPQQPQAGRGRLLCL